eukprot:m.11681 g.11681  ORF g.11681 m.11681 type:complete len:277 (-) comp4468_c0_seq2:53-883(-)
MKSEGGCGMLPPCPGCAGEGVLFLRASKFGDGKWWGCSDWKYGCKFRVNYKPQGAIDSGAYLKTPAGEAFRAMVMNPQQPAPSKAVAACPPLASAAAAPDPVALKELRLAKAARMKEVFRQKREEREKIEREAAVTVAAASKSNTADVAEITHETPVPADTTKPSTNGSPPRLSASSDRAPASSETPESGGTTSLCGSRRSKELQALALGSSGAGERLNEVDAAPRRGSRKRAAPAASVGGLQVNVAELKRRLKSRKLSTAGRKAELVERLAADSE